MINKKRNFKIWKKKVKNLMEKNDKKQRRKQIKQKGKSSKKEQ